MTPTNEAGHGLPELPVPWSDYWASKGNWALSHNYAAFELADEWLRANLDALALSRGAPESGRYFVDGPQGSFFTSDKTFADLFVREVDDPDDWTITDLSNPTGTAPAAAGAQCEEWRCFYCSEVFTDRESAALHFGSGNIFDHKAAGCQIDLAAYRAMEELVSRYQEEDAPIHRQLHRMAGEHAAALRREEERGYARGLRDSGLCPCSAPPPARRR